MNTEIKYPDSLIELWRSMQPRENEENLSKPNNEHSKKIADIWIKLCNSLTKSILSFQHNLSLDKAQQEASDFLVELVHKPYGEIQAKRQYSYLVRDLRKQISMKENPGGYELSQIIRTAIRKLEKNNEIVRDKDSQDKNISQLTFFKLTNSPDREASFADYESNVNKVSQYKTEMRHGNIENSRIISPQNAQKLIKELLAAFNGWISWGVLFSTALRHIPEDSCFRLETLQESPEGQESKEQIDKLNHKLNTKEEESHLSEEAEIKYFYEGQSCVLIKGKSDQIWALICKKAETKFFCLYHIPKHYGDDNDPKPVLKDFGPPQTMSDMDKRISEILSTEMQVLPSKHQQSINIRELQKKTISYIISSIFEKLYHRCTENGYDPHLSAYESKKTTN